MDTPNNTELRILALEQQLDDAKTEVANLTCKLAEVMVERQELSAKLSVQQQNPLTALLDKLMAEYLASPQVQIKMVSMLDAAFAAEFDSRVDALRDEAKHEVDEAFEAAIDAINSHSVEGLVEEAIDEALSNVRITFRG